MAPHCEVLCLEGPGAQCAVLCREVQATLRDADERWRALEDRLDQVSRDLLGQHFEELREPLGLRDGDLQSTAEGSLRHKVRARIERLVLAPLADRMRQQAGMRVASNFAAGYEADGRHVLDDFFDHWDSEVEPLLRDAGVEDARLERKVRRQEEKGFCAAPAIAKVEVQQEIIWSNPQGALEVFSRYTRRLGDFLEAQASDAAVDEIVSALPVVVARAVCDWRYARCVAECEQLDSWWQGTRAGLQKRAQLWEQLLQEEGIFIRRVERGVEALSTARLRYASLADFGVAFDFAPDGGGLGGGAWPRERVALLAEAVKDMRTRLRPIRDSAAWRLVNVAKALQWRLAGAAADAAQRELSPWECVGRQEGARALAEALVSQEAKKGCLAPTDATDAALVFMQRLDRLLAAIGDVRDFLAGHVGSAPDGRGSVLAALEAVLRAGAVASEELLGVLDEPSDAGLEAWRRQWDRIGVAAEGRSMATALLAVQWTPESKMGIEERQFRKSRLLLLRGILVFLEEPGFRNYLLEPLEGNLGSFAMSAFTAQCLSGLSADAAHAAQAAVAEEAVDHPPHPAADAELSHREGCDYCPPSRRAPSEAVLPAPKVLGGGRPPSAGPAREVAAPPQNGCFEEAVTDVEVPAGSPGRTPPWGLPSAATRPSTVDGTSRPVTPSWLMPPWPRPDTPALSMASSWTRPETPSTVCDDTELAHLPRVKFVDGQRVSLRPGVTIQGARLPPLLMPPLNLLR